MKRSGSFCFIILYLIIGFISCHNPSNSTKTDTPLSEENISEEGTPILKFSVDSYDFGDISPGEKVSYAFKYTNEGDANLIIISATAGCGCTVPKWVKDPISPGEEGFVEVVFDSSGRSGKQIKNITIRSNGDPSVKSLQIQANIVEPNS